MGPPPTLGVFEHIFPAQRITGVKDVRLVTDICWQWKDRVRFIPTNEIDLGSGEGGPKNITQRSDIANPEMNSIFEAAQSI